MLVAFGKRPAALRKVDLMNNRKIILPGEKIAEGRTPTPGAFPEGGATYAAVMGMMDEEGRFIPLERRYRPVVDDVVVGMVTDSRHAGYDVELNLPNVGFIPSRELRMKLELGDFVVCKIREVTEVGDMDLGDVRRLPKGKIIAFPPAKVPRLIGKKLSMINMIKESVGDVLVGNNGYVWISEKADMPLAIKAITMIDDGAHLPGLTDRVAALFAQEKKVKVI
jgi:exosome complex component RRP4